ALVTGKEAEQFYKQQKELSEIDDALERLLVERAIAARNKKLKEAAANKEAKPPEQQRNNETPSARGTKAGVPKDSGSLPADYDRDAHNHEQAFDSKRAPEDVEAEWNRVRARKLDLHTRYLTVPKAYAVVEGLPTSAQPIHRKGNPNSLGEEI